jgi:transposase
MNTGCSAKKSLHASERDSPRVEQARADYEQTALVRLDTAHFHFLDETGLRLDYTRAVGAERAVGAVPVRRGSSLTLIGTLSMAGLGAVQLLEGALTQRSFVFYVVHCLAPTLRPGDVLVLDNLSVHKVQGAAEWLVTRGVEVLFLPPYSPDFAPIEQAWSKLKTKLRSAQARTRQALEEALSAAIHWITSDDAKAWFGHCGYSPNLNGYTSRETAI